MVAGSRAANTASGMRRTAICSTTLAYGNLSAEEDLGVARRPLAGSPVQRLAAVHHAEERGQLGRRIGPIGPLDQSRDRSQRQHRRNGRHEHGVRRGEDALGQQREACRTVEEHDVVVTAERVEECRDHAFRLAEVTEQPIELAVGEVRGQQVEIVVVGLLDGCGERLAALQALLAETLRRAAGRGRRSSMRPAGRGPRAACAGRRPRRDTTGSRPSWSFRRHPSCCRPRRRSSDALRRSRSLERAPAGRPRVVRAESLSALDDLAAQTLAALTALFGQPPEREQAPAVRRRRRARARIRAAASPAPARR